MVVVVVVCLVLHSCLSRDSSTAMEKGGPLLPAR